MYSQTVLSECEFEKVLYHPKGDCFEIMTKTVLYPAYFTFTYQINK